MRSSVIPRLALTLCSRAAGLYNNNNIKLFNDTYTRTQLTRLTEHTPKAKKTFIIVNIKDKALEGGDVEQ